MTTRATHAGVSLCRVIWEDSSRDQLEAYYYEGKHRISADAVDLPTDVDGKRRLLTELADALGMEWEGLRAKPRPFRVGDVVEKHHFGVSRRGTVSFVGGRRLLVARLHDEEAWLKSECTLITPAEEVEQGEVEQSEGECEWHSSDPEVCCDTSDPNTGFVCTRPAGHAGLHIACGVKEGDLHDLARWSA